MLDRTGANFSTKINQRLVDSTADPSKKPTGEPRNITPESAGILDDLDRSANAAGAHDQGQPFAVPHHSWPLRTNIDSTPEALTDLFDHLNKHNPHQPIAIISGGSLSGCTTALELACDGYQVIVAEKRKTYNRQNVLSLKTDTLLYMASLSPDGSLLRDMVKNRFVTPCTHEIVADQTSDTGYSAVKNSSVRFLNWLLPERALRPQIPVRDRRAEPQAQPQDLAGMHDTLRRKPNPRHIEALDLAWPVHEPVTAVAPTDWRAPPAEFFSSDNMVLGQTCDLEKSLNECCLRHPSIHVVNAEIELQCPAGEDADYHPLFKMGDENNPKTFSPSQDIELICLAEGSQSPNRNLIGGEWQPVATNESWQQGNYIGAASSVGGFNAVDVQPDTIIVTQHIEQPGQSLANVSVFHPTDQPPSADSIVSRLHLARAHVDTVKSPVNISENHRQYDSGPIDINLRMARNPIKRNVIQVGDNAFSGTPAGGYGGSMGTSQFCQLVSETVNHPDFNSSDPVRRQRVEDYYRKGVADIHAVRTGRPTTILRKLGVYSPQTVEASGRQAATARFEGLAPIDLPPLKPEDQR